jgi:phospholipase C
MDRRTFLKTTSGVAAASSVLTARGLSSKASSQIQHIVVVMMENRSFDHLVGWMPNSDGKQAGLSYTNPSGQTSSTYPLAPEWTGCGHPDPDHSYEGGRTEYDNGKMDGFLMPASNDVYAIGYYQQNDFSFLPQFALNYTVCDRYFPSILAPTFPNRIFQLCGQTDRLNDSISLCSLPTIFDHLQAAGVSHKYYFGNIPFIALFGLKYLPIVADHTEFLADCAAGTLPAVSFVDPALTLLLNFANDNHPHSDMRNGDAFLAQTFNAVANSPNWPSTVFINNYDEWGGFFEHIVPPRALAPNNVDPDLIDGKALLGCRVPCIVASPWTRGNPQNPTVNSTVFDHTSVLQLIESVFNVPPMAARETSGDVGNLLSLINLDAEPQPAPALPSPSPVFPQQVCASSINPSGGDADAAIEQDHNSFQKFADSPLMQGWPVKL